MVRLVPSPSRSFSERQEAFLFLNLILINLAPTRMNRRKADFKFAYKFLEDDL